MTMELGDNCDDDINNGGSGDCGDYGDGNNGDDSNCVGHSGDDGGG